MGQRLVVDLYKNNEVVASVYYHWSAYFSSTIYELARLSEAILNAEKTGKDKILAIIEMLETNHEYSIFPGVTEIECGGVRGTKEDLDAAKAMFPDHEFKEDNVNRNSGIITFIKSGIDSYHDWGEGFGYIDLGTHEVSHGVTYEHEPFEFEENDEDIPNSGKISLNGKTCPINAFDCTCESILDLYDFMDKAYEEWKNNNIGFKEYEQGNTHSE